MTEMSSFARDVFLSKYSLKDGDGRPTEEWEDTARRVVDAIMRPLLPDLADATEKLIAERKFFPGGRYLYAAGKRRPMVNNCLLMRAEDSREGWATLMHNVVSGLMAGAGVGIDYTALRQSGAPVTGMGGTSTGPLALMNMVNESGRHIMQGGGRRAALWAGLAWDHPDVLTFIDAKNWSAEIKAAKEVDYLSPGPLDGTNISVILNDDFFKAFHDHNDPQHDWASEVYWKTVEQMLTTAEPGFSVNTGVNRNETLRNACTEICSEDDSDICNLGSLNLARITSREEFSDAVELATAFLLCGSILGHVPYDKVRDIRAKNRRLGLGLMGVHEWLIQRRKPYAPDPELGDWLAAYATSTDIAHRYADRLNVSHPIKTRALAPVGTIGILGETTTSAEPPLAVAYKRAWLDGPTRKTQVVIEPIAKRLAEAGIDPDSIETAFTLAKDPERRVTMQAWLQRYVDHGIASTVNLPPREEQQFTVREFGTMLIRYLPHLRGITCYPDGSRGGQPLTPMTYAEALEWGEGYTWDEVGNSQACASGVCGV